MIRYVPPPAAAGGVEVMSIAELHQRMRGHGADGTGHLQRPEFHLLLTVTAGELRHMVDFADYTVTEGNNCWRVGHH